MKKMLSSDSLLARIIVSKHEHLFSMLISSIHNYRIDQKIFRHIPLSNHDICKSHHFADKRDVNEKLLLTTTTITTTTITIERFRAAL